MDDFNLTEKSDWLWRLMFAQCICLFFLLFDLINFSVPLMGEIRPYLFLMTIYYWAIFRPTLLPALWIFVLGILYDVVLGFPLGLHSILFLVVQYIVRRQRLYLMGQPFTLVWLGFVITCSLVALCEWGFFSALHLQPMPFMSGMFSFLCSAVVFPFIQMMLLFNHRLLPESHEHYREKQ